MAIASVPTPESSADRQPEADPEQVARTIVLRRLDSAPRTRHELKDLLLSRGVPEDVAERVLARFCEVGLIDDESYAMAWVESRHRARGSARPVLRRELQRKGVDAGIADEALARIDSADERDRARELVTVKRRSLLRYEPDVRVRRLVGMLQRRGYSAGVAYAVVREIEGEAVDAIPDDGC